MATEQRLIYANDLTEQMAANFAQCMYDGVDSEECQIALDTISEAPTVDAVEVVHGRWDKAHIAGYLKCNCCEDAFIYEEWLESGKWSYCPNCGAKMDGGADDA